MTELDKLIEAVDRLPPGKWEVWTSCSYRRITAEIDGRSQQDGGVLHAYRQRSDGHPDLSMDERELQAICDIVNGLRACRAAQEQT